MLLLFLSQLAAVGQITTTTILTNGPNSNRFNIVFLSEGYTASQLVQFRIDVTNALNGLLAHQPYSEYRNYFNAYAIAVPSVQAGTSFKSERITNDTYFNSSFDSSYRLITIPPDNFDTNYNHGQGKIDGLVKSNVPNSSLAVLLVNNSINAGGSDGFDKTAITSMAFGFEEILTHETGHVVANLGDEYDDHVNMSYPGEDPNTTRQTNRAQVKWNVWIDPVTPVPTPSIYDVVGLYRGARYNPTNSYRPQLNCLMRGQYSPFCSVCTETMILGYYRKVRPIDAFLPLSTNLSITTTQPMAFSLTLLRPVTDELSIQWFADGVALSGATNSAYLLLPGSFANGIHTLRAFVRDNTALVRNDPANLLGQTLAWNLTVSIPQLRLTSAVALAGGKFVFRVSGAAPAGVVIQSSTNLSTWQSIATNSLIGGQFMFTNNGVNVCPEKFFRAKTPP
jgi:hypothetical protein